MSSSTFSGHRLMWMFGALLGAMTLSITVSVGPTVESLPDEVEVRGASSARATPVDAGQDSQTIIASVSPAKRKPQPTDAPATSQMHDDDLATTPAPRGRQRKSRHSNVREPLNNHSNFVWSTQDACLTRRN
ncbi:membrane-associated protein, putative, partial [Bodo saltans]